MIQHLDKPELPRRIFDLVLPELACRDCHGQGEAGDLPMTWGHQPLLAGAQGLLPPTGMASQRFNIKPMIYHRSLP